MPPTSRALSSLASLSAFFLLSALAGCDCEGGPPPGRPCDTSSDCPTDQFCVDQKCTRLDEIDGSVMLPDGEVLPTDAPMATATGLRLEPASANLVSSDGSMPVQDFEAIVSYSDGTERPARTPRFTLSDRKIGEVGDGNGTFTANGTIGGTVTLTVEAAVGGAAMTVTGTIAVHIDRTVIPGDVPADIVTRFAAAGAPVADPARTANTVYPLNGVVFPQNVYPADVQWLVGATGDFYRITITRPGATIVGYAPYDGQNHWLVEQTAWRTVAQSGTEAEAATLTVDRLEATTGQIVSGDPITLKFADAALAGSVYYWDIAAGRIRRINDGSGTAEDFMPSPPLSARPAEGQCVGCHSVSNNGRYMSGRLGGGDNVGTVFDLTTDLTANPAPSIWSPTGQGLYWWFSSWNPDDTRMVVAADVARGSGVPYLGVYDPIAGTTITPPGSTGLIGTHPAWSPDGTRIAYVRGDGSWGDNITTGDIAIVPIAADAFGAAVTIQDGSTLGGGSSENYPTWSPDSMHIAFGHGTSSRSDNLGGTSDLWMMSPDGSGPVQLAIAGTAGHVDYQPRFSPFQAGGYYWLSFLSRRIYGNPQRGNTASAPQMRQQIWVSAIQVSGTGDVSSVPYWVSGQNPLSANISAFWTRRACRPDGESCTVGSECCGGLCIPPAGGGAPVCSPPPAEMCRQEGETCTTDADCCEGENLTCYANVCVESPG